MLGLMSESAAADFVDHHSCGDLSRRRRNRLAHRRRSDPPLHLCATPSAARSSSPARCCGSGSSRATGSARSPGTRYRHFELLLRSLRHRRGLPYDQSAAVRRPARLHRQSRRRSLSVRRHDLSAAGRALAAAPPARLPDRADDRRRHGPQPDCRSCLLRGSCSPPRRRISPGPSSTSARPPRSATPPAPPATRKGALYSHRSTVLHAFGISLPDAISISAGDVVCPVVPLFHVCGWGSPYAAPMNGAKLVLPGPRLDGASLYELFEAEGSPTRLGVPTVWLGFEAYLSDSGQALLDPAAGTVRRLRGAAVDDRGFRADTASRSARAGA